MYNKVLAVVAALTLGWLILLWYAIAYGATAFPFTHTGQQFGPGWKPFGEARAGYCEMANFTGFQLVSQDERTGWYIYYSSNEKVVAVRYALNEDGKGTPNLIVFARVKAKGLIEIWGERAFDTVLDQGPCQWFDVRDA